MYNISYNISYKLLRISYRYAGAIFSGAIFSGAILSGAIFSSAFITDYREIYPPPTRLSRI